MYEYLIANQKTIIIWLGALCTLGIYSILYKENKIYRFFEHVFIGLATGWAIKMAWVDVLRPTWFERTFIEGRWWWFYAVPLALLMYLIYTKKYNWMARITIGVLLGFNAGQQFQQFSGLYYKQIVTTFKPIVPQGPGESAMGPVQAVSVSGALNNLLFMAILVCVMTYFFFSFEQKNKVVRNAAATGRWVLMIAFGAIFGSTIMARMALFISRMDFLIHTWMPTVPGIGRFFGP
jgi:hypothetical protein